MANAARWGALLLLAVLAAGCFGPFAVTGQVVDQDGHPLSDVTLHTTASVRTDYEFDAYGGESSTLLEDGEFSVRCASCSAMHLFFTKDGYHGKSLDLAFFEWWGDHTVVLTQIGPTVDLNLYRAKLSVSIDDADTVMALPKHDPRNDDYTKERATLTQGEPHVALKPALAEDGSFAIDVGVPDGMRTIRYAELDFSAANGVAQIHDAPVDRFDNILSEMVAAPRDGYAPTLRLHGKQLGQIYFFYCIVDGHYCKGTVTAPGLRFEGDTPRLRAEIELYINRDPSNRGLDDPRGYLR